MKNENRRKLVIPCDITEIKSIQEMLNQNNESVLKKYYCIELIPINSLDNYDKLKDIKTNGFVKILSPIILTKNKYMFAEAIVSVINLARKDKKEDITIFFSKNFDEKTAYFVSNEYEKNPQVEICSTIPIKNKEEILELESKEMTLNKEKLLSLKNLLIEFFTGKDKSEKKEPTKKKDCILVQVDMDALDKSVTEEELNIFAKYINQIAKNNEEVIILPTTDSNDSEVANRIFNFQNRLFSKINQTFYFSISRHNNVFKSCRTTLKEQSMEQIYKDMNIIKRVIFVDSDKLGEGKSAFFADGTYFVSNNQDKKTPFSTWIPEYERMEKKQGRKFEKELN